MQSRFVAIQLEFFVFHDTRMHLITGDAMPKLSPTISNALVLLSRLLFAVVCFFAWKGKIGLPALLTLSLSTVLFWVGHRGLSTENQKIASFWAKGLFTIVGIMALLRHPIPCPKDAPECTPLPVVTAIMQYIEQVDGQTFLLFAVIAMAIKFIGVLSSAYAWHLLLQGQGLRFAYWQTTVTSFLIGRFIGTFLPSTMGLDGYTLYEAGKYSNEWTRVFTAKALEKFIGITGLFLGITLTLPFGYSVLLDVTANKPGAAMSLALIIAGICGGVSLVVVLGLVRPALLIWFVRIFGKFIPKKVSHKVEEFANSVGAYRGKTGLLMVVLLSKFITHFTTAMVYYFTALAIGVTTAQFWPIVFGSNIQILGTLFSPTIAGEGAREALQALLLEKQLGGVAQAVLSGALGFIAAEAATMWGGAFLWTRKPEWRPSPLLIDDQPASYTWLDNSDSPASFAELQANIQEKRISTPT